MQLIGVIDLAGGLAVHARGGRREAYAPVECVAGTTITAGDAVALGRAYVEQLGIADIYVADLDAIVRGAPSSDALPGLAALGATLWIDGGASSADAAVTANVAGADHVVVGLETLESFAQLREICNVIGPGHVAFSLDLRDGMPVAKSAAYAARTPEALAAEAVEAGAGSVIVLDLARVGTGRGVNEALLARIRAAAPDVMLLAGGGVRGPDDLQRLSDVGFDGALVATALLDGRLSRADVRAAQARQRA